MPSPFRQSLDAIALACAGWFLFCVYDAIVKWLSGSLGILQIAGTVFTATMLLSGGWILFRHGVAGFRTPHLKLYLLRGVSLVFAGFFVLSALARIPLADFYGIIFLTPMATTILAVFFLNERIGWHRIVAIITGFTGVLLIAGPSFAAGNIGYLFTLCAVVFTSSNAILLRKIGPEKIRARFAFYPSLVGSVVFLPLMMMDMTIPADAMTWSLLLLAPLVSLGGVILFSMGYSRAREAGVVAPFHYTQMIWGALFGFVIFGDVPTLWTVVGSLIIAGSGLMIIWREHVHHRQIATPVAENPL